MCVDCVLASPRIAQVDPGDGPPSEVVLSHRGLWKMTSTAAKARASHPAAQLGRQCGRTAPCRGVANLLPLHGLLRWRGTRSTSPWTESTNEVASRGGIRSRARGGTPINGRFQCIKGKKDCAAPLSKWKNSSSD
jgi:hypothetical protein